MSKTMNSVEEMSIDVIKNNVFHSDLYSSNDSHKRSFNSDESYDKKRVKDEENDKYPPIARFNDFQSYAEEEDKEEEYEELSEMDQMLRQLSFQIINFDLNYEPLDWDIKDTIDHKTIQQMHQKKDSLSDVQFPPETGQVIHGYQLQTLVTATKRTAVFIGFDVKKPDKEVVIKIGFEMGFHSIQNEWTTYMKLKTSTAVPKLVDYLWWRVYREDYTSIRWGFIILEKCGPNLVDLMKSSSLGMIPISNAFEVAIKMIDAIEALHETGFLHLSLKPEHFILESVDKPNLKLIGLNASKTYLKKSFNGNMKHIEEQKGRKLPKGDPNFHSIGYHNGYRRSRRDDMESLGYCLIYLVKGTLPWIDPFVNDLSSAKVIHSVGQRMQSTSLEVLCSGLPPQFRRYFELIEKYQFVDKPNYEELGQCFRLNAQ